MSDKFHTCEYCGIADSMVDHEHSNGMCHPHSDDCIAMLCRQRDQLRSEVEALKHDLRQYMSIANEHVAEVERLQNPWRTVQVLTDDGPEPVEDAIYPDDGQWVVVEVRCAVSLDYKAIKHNPRSWPSFGLRWMPLPLPEDDS